MAAKRRAAKPVARPADEGPIEVPGLVTERNLAVLETALDDAFGEEVRFEDLKGSKIMLDVLQALPLTHPQRVGVTAIVEHVPANNEAQLQPGDWDVQLPTYEYLGSLVRAGDFPAGNYRISLRQGGRACPLIKFKVGAPPRKPGEGQAAEPLAQVQTALAMVKALQPSGGTDRVHQMQRDLDAAVREIEHLTTRLDQMDQAVVAMATAINEAATAEPAEDEDPDGFKKLLPQALEVGLNILASRGGADPALNGGSEASA